MRALSPALCFVLSLASALSVPAAPLANPSGSFSPDAIKFVAHRVGTYRSEACGVADFNNDGKLDIVAGEYLYLGPDFKPQKIRSIEGKVDDQGKGYTWDFMNGPLDVDGDGLLDIVTCSWHGMKSEWCRNPGPSGGLWPTNLIEKNGNFEHGDLYDIDNDGKAHEILPVVQSTVWYEVAQDADGKRSVVKHVVSEKAYDWGVGAGDVNGDGRCDILRPNAWFEAPAELRKGVWKEHAWALGGKDESKPDHTPQILVYDVNQDGLNDIVTSSAHQFGIWWYQQIRNGDDIGWKRHLIDDTWSQAHSLALADLDNDGDLDLVTGKRFMAHDGGDPDEYAPLGVYWYQLQRGPNPTWNKHVISYNQGIGSGMNVVVIDLDGDGDLDIVVTGKWGGPAWFENRAISR